MKQYTVIVARPDYISDGPTDTYMAHVEADNVAKAQAQAQLETFEADTGPDDEEFGSYEDYAIVAVFVGHLQDISVN